MKRLVAILVLVFLAPLCGGCADEPFKGIGTITAREYDDDDSYDYWVAPTPGSCSGSGVSTVCTGGTPGYWAHHHEPERWLVTLRYSQPKEVKEGELPVSEVKVAVVSVPYEVYRDCQDGQRLNAATMECMLS